MKKGNSCVGRSNGVNEEDESSIVCSVSGSDDRDSRERVGRKIKMRSDEHLGGSIVINVSLFEVH
jgi:hypothetical protein